MITEPIKITTATDADAAYVINRLSEAQEHDTQAKQNAEGMAEHKARAREARLEAGRRLIEVRARYGGTEARPATLHNAPGWLAWLRDNDIARETARDLIRNASVTEEQRAEHRRKERDRKREERGDIYRKTWTDVLLDNKAIDPVLLRGGSHVGTAKKIEKAGIELPEGRFFTDESTAEKFAQDYVRAFPPKEPLKHNLSKSDDRKLAKAIALETERLKGIFMQELYAEVDRRIPEITAERERTMEENREETRRYRILNATTRKILTSDDYRFLLQVLHPDRAPAGREEQYARAFQIIQRLREYAEA